MKTMMVEILVGLGVSHAVVASVPNRVEIPAFETKESELPAVDPQQVPPVEEPKAKSGSDASPANPASPAEKSPVVPSLPTRAELRQLFLDKDWIALGGKLEEIRKHQTLDLEQFYMEAVVREERNGIVAAGPLLDRVFQQGYETTPFLRRYVNSLYKRGNFDRAQKVVWTLLNRIPGDREIQFSSALIDIQLAEYNSALKTLQKLKSQDRSKKEIHQALLFVSDKLDRPEIRTQALKELMWLEPDNVEWAQSYLHALSRKGIEGSKAKAFFEEAQKIRNRFPNHPGVNRFMARACRAIGRDDLARFYENESGRRSP